MRAVAYLLRLVFLAALVRFVVLGDLRGLVFFGAVFIVTLPILYWARTRREAYRADAGIMAVFLASIVLGMLGVHLQTDILGLDKLFHLAGGALLGYLFVLLSLKKWSAKKKALAALLATLTVAVGWECFEWTFWLVTNDPTLHNPLLIWDSLLDITAGVLGAGIVAFARRKARPTAS